LRLIKLLLKDRARVHPFAGNGGSWREAVIGRSPNVSQMQQRTRTRRSIGLHMSQTAPENLRELVEVCPLERHVPSTLDNRHHQAGPACPFRANSRQLIQSSQ